MLNSIEYYLLSFPVSSYGSASHLSWHMSRLVLPAHPCLAHLGTCLGGELPAHHPLANLGNCLGGELPAFELGFLLFYLFLKSMVLKQWSLQEYAFGLCHLQQTLPSLTWLGPFIDNSLPLASCFVLSFQSVLKEWTGGSFANSFAVDLLAASLVGTGFHIRNLHPLQEFIHNITHEYTARHQHQLTKNFMPKSIKTNDMLNVHSIRVSDSVSKSGQTLLI